MARSQIFACAAVWAFALAGCTGGGSGSSAPGNGLETVDDAAAIVAHRPTGSQNAAAAIGAVDALGSLVNDLSPLGQNRTGTHGCRDGSEFVTPSRNGDPQSTEVREFFDAGCTLLARDTVRTFRPIGQNGESEAVAVSIYAQRRAAPIGLRLEFSQVRNARFGRFGFPIARDGFVKATTRQLLVSNQRQSVTNAQTSVSPGTGNDAGGLCMNTAGYNAAGIPSLDATFGWQGSTVDSGVPIRSDDRNGVVTIATTQVGDTFAGPVGSLSLLAAASNAACPNAAPAYGLAGAATTSSFTIPIRVTYRDGRLWSLQIARASFAGGYTLRLASTRALRQHGAISISGLLSNGGTHVASLSADAFGNGELTITSTGAQYRLVDWTVVV